MPQVTVYIRDEDLPAWRGVIKKSEFMHNALQNHSTYDGAKIVLREELPEVAEEETTDYYGGKYYLPATNDVYDEVAGELLEEITPELVKELKRRGQTR